MMRLRWTEPVAEYHGEFHDLPACRMDPKPLQTPHIPIIVGGHSSAGFRRAAKYGNGWYGFQLDVAGTAEVCKSLDNALAEQGRSREDFELIITPTFNVTMDMVKAYEDLGVDRLIVHLGNQKPERVDQRLREIEKLIGMLT